MAELPLDVLTDILLRLPAKTLSRFKCANKSWQELIESPYFIRRQCDRAHAIYNDDRHTYIVHNRTAHGSEEPNFENMVYDEINPDPIFGPLFAYPVDAIPPVFLHNNKVAVIGHCDGMLCVRVVHTNGLSIVLWNPTIRDFEKLPSLPEKHYIYESYGLGHNPQIDDNYVVKIPCLLDDVQVLDYHNWVEIFYFKSRAWRRICKLENHHVFSEEAIFVNGKLNWLATNTSERNKRVIIQFNPIEERFEELALPFPLGFVDSFEDPILDVVHGHLYVIKRCANGIVYWVFEEGTRWVKVHYIPKWPSLLRVEKLRHGVHPLLKEVLFRPLCVTRHCIYLSAGGNFVKRFELKDNKPVGSFEMKSEEVFCPGLGDLLHKKKKYTLVETLVSPSRLLS